jgi:hypothetical protein
VAPRVRTQSSDRAISSKRRASASRAQSPNDMDKWMTGSLNQSCMKCCACCRNGRIRFVSRAWGRGLGRAPSETSVFVLITRCICFFVVCGARPSSIQRAATCLATRIRCCDQPPIAACSERHPMHSDAAQPHCAGDLADQNTWSFNVRMDCIVSVTDLAATESIRKREANLLFV